MDDLFNIKMSIIIIIITNNYMLIISQNNIYNIFFKVIYLLL
jgi:hypothetical protein